MTYDITIIRHNDSFSMVKTVKKTFQMAWNINCTRKCEILIHKILKHKKNDKYSIQTFM
jgi:hypothetical protein